MRTRATNDREQSMTTATTTHERVTVCVSIGSETKAFVLTLTNAPRAYDSGEAIELHDSTYTNAGREHIERYVLVPEEQIDWQVARNLSGLHTCQTDLEDVMLDARDVERYLWQRIYNAAK